MMKRMVLVVLAAILGSLALRWRWRRPKRQARSVMHAERVSGSRQPATARLSDRPVAKDDPVAACPNARKGAKAEQKAGLRPAVGFLSARARLGIGLAIFVAVIASTSALQQGGQSFIVEGATNPTLLGFRANEQGNGALNLGYTGGNLGNTWAEGEWVPYQLILTLVQDDFPNFGIGTASEDDDLEIEISYDFFKAQGGQDARFVDLVRGLQVSCTTNDDPPAAFFLDDSEGWPMPGGTAFPMATREQLETAQNHFPEETWSGFTLLNLPNSQINRALGGGDGTPTTERHVFIIHPADLVAAGCGSESETIIIYWALHESRTFIWSNMLQSGYDTSPTDGWGGYLYGDCAGANIFCSDQRNGSSFSPGSSGHIHLETLSGSQDVPIPIPERVGGEICGFKWLDSNGDGVKDDSESFLPDWPIHITGEVEGIPFGPVTQLTDENGEYCFLDLTAGTWIVEESADDDTGDSDVYIQTWPDLGESTSSGLGTGVASSPPPPALGPVAWEIELTIDDETESGANFGNLLPDAFITISPLSADNEAGTNHVLTVHVEENIDGTFQDAAGECVVVTISGVGSLVDDDDDDCNSANGDADDCVTDSNGDCEITITSAVAGTTTVHASSNVDVGGGVTLFRETDGTGNNSGDATKDWVKVRISISPLDDDNEVGTNHVLTIFLEKSVVDGVWTPLAGEEVVATITNSLGATAAFVANADDTDGDGDCVTGADGKCDVTINSPTAGNTDVEATWAGGTVEGASISSKATNPDANKDWVAVRISISPLDDDNEVGTNHVLTIFLEKSVEADVWTPLAGEEVVATITNSLGATAAFVVGGDDGDGDGDCVTGADGKCDVVIDSPTAGNTDVEADWAGGTVEGASVSAKTTNPDANKDWVAVRISISPDGTNFIHDDHDLTIFLEKSVEAGVWTPLGGEEVVATISNSGGATAAFVANLDDTDGDGDCVTGADGKCDVTINSPTAGNTDVEATWAGGTVEGASVSSKTTEPDADKDWIAASVSLTKTFDIGPISGNPGEVCFTLTRVPVPGDPVSSDPATQCDSDPGASTSFQWDDLIAGVHTIEETTVPAGYIKIDDIVFTVAEDCTGIDDCVEASTSPSTENLGSFNNPLPPGDLNLLKVEGPFGTAWTGPDVTLYICANSPLSNSSEQPLQDCDEAAEADEVVVLTSSQPMVTVTDLPEGYYTICEFPVPPTYVVDDQCQVATVLAGVTGGTAATVTFENTPPSEGCTPGFWQGGNGSQLWNELNDPDWDGNGTNPFAHDTVFSSFFTDTGSDLADLTMIEIVSTGGGNSPERKAMRDVVAAYLNSAYGLNNGLSTSDVIDLWDDAVSEGTNSAFNELHAILAPVNELGCPI